MKFNLGIAFTVLLFFLTSPIDANNDGGLCKNKRKGDGTQIKTGFCSETVLGQVPSISHMTSSLIIAPNNEQKLPAFEGFTVNVKVKNLKTGFFSNPDKQYYAKGQQLSGGIIKGHSHITIQRLDDERNAPDAEKFVAFKGLNDPANNGVLTLSVEEGLGAGRYRICTMSSSFTHQPVVMPVAKRGSQDDCIRITVIEDIHDKHGKHGKHDKNDKNGKNGKNDKNGKNGKNDKNDKDDKNDKNDKQKRKARSPRSPRSLV